jgi:hypothetical protein
MAVSLDVLQALASSFSAVRDGGQLIQPGSPVAFHVLNANPLLTVTDVLSAEMNLAWITKDVRFNDFETESVLDESPFVPTDIDSLLAGGMPVRVSGRREPCWHRITTWSARDTEPIGWKYPDLGLGPR